MPHAAAPVPAAPPGERQERFIAHQLAALRDLGLPPAMLAREEALLRGGFAAGAVFAGLLAR